MLLPKFTLLLTLLSLTTLTLTKAEWEPDPRKSNPKYCFDYPKTRNNEGCELFCHVRSKP